MWFLLLVIFMPNCKFCQTSITEHEAGRETDECIALSLGFKKSKNRKGFTQVWLTGKKEWFDWEIPVEEFKPSTNLNQAIKLWRDGWQIKKHPTAGYIVFEVYLAQDMDFVDIKAGTLALAIVRAYLLEKMKEEGK